MGRRRRFVKPRRIREVREHKINLEIRSETIRLIEIGGEPANDVLTPREAMDIADKMEMDLVEISPNAVPPVAKIIEYSKFAYDLKKKKKEQKAKQHQTTLKEIRFGPNTDDHDFDFKMKSAEKFLKEGNKLKTFIQFRGRNIIYKDRGRDLMQRIEERLEGCSKVEMRPKMEGRRMIMILTPK